MLLGRNYTQPLGSTPHKGPLVPALHQYLHPSKQDTSACLLDSCKMYCSVYVKSRRAYDSPTVGALPSAGVLSNS